MEQGAGGAARRAGRTLDDIGVRARLFHDIEARVARLHAATSSHLKKVAVANMEAKAKTEATVSGLTEGGKSGR